MIRRADPLSGELRNIATRAGYYGEGDSLIKRSLINKNLNKSSIRTFCQS
jgi:hypothetical protein